MDIEAKYYSYNGKRLAHIRCLSKTGTCPERLITKQLDSHTVKSSISKKMHRAQQIRNNGRRCVALNPKSARNVEIYIKLLSLDETKILSLLNTLGLVRTQRYVERLARSNLKASRISSMQDAFDTIISELSDELKNYLSSICSE